MHKHEGKWLGGCCFFTVMRSILLLFVMAALGFAIILKKDAPQPTAPKKRPDQHSQTSRRNSTKQRLDQNGAEADVALNKRQQNPIH
jgi:hypothetical protein